MRTYFLADIHGNLPALEIALNDLNHDDKVIILGDVVNYGPWSDECVELLDSLKNKVCIRGNHEKYFIDGCYPKEGLVNDFFNFCYNKFKNINILKSYKDKAKFEEFVCIHTINEQYIFKDTDIDIDSNYIIGHSHQQYFRKIKNLFIVNPGSAGQNRSNINIVSYCFFDHDKNKFQFINKEYNSELIIKKMKSLGYPLKCIDYYEKKNK